MTALVPSAPRRLVLADRVFPRHLVVDATLVVLGAAFVGGLAQVYIPLWPVPVTGQTLAVLLVGATLGSLRGALALAVYAAFGILGVPWFSEADSGFDVIAGPTGGYIIGFIASAFLVGWLSEREWDRKILKALATFAGGTLVVFAFGLPWLAFSLGIGVDLTLEYGLWPFVIGGIVKALVAAALLPLAWFGANKLEKRTD
ncbi:MAG: biotin transporter BioY [Pseudolysinimonas sp.]